MFRAAEIAEFEPGDADGGELRYGEDRQIIDAGFVLTDELRAELGDVSFGGLDSQRPGLFETFHTDDSYVEMSHARDRAPRSRTAGRARRRDAVPRHARHTGSSIVRSRINSSDCAR